MKLNKNHRKALISELHSAKSSAETAKLLGTKAYKEKDHAMEDHHTISEFLHDLVRQAIEKALIENEIDF